MYHVQPQDFLSCRFVVRAQRTRGQVLTLDVYLSICTRVCAFYGARRRQGLALRKLRTSAATAATVVDELILGSYIIVININGLL
jgi:hypothetical protein